MLFYGWIFLEDPWVIGDLQKFVKDKLHVLRTAIICIEVYLIGEIPCKDGEPTNPIMYLIKHTGVVEMREPESCLLKS